MNYEKIYNDLILSVKGRGTRKELGYEVHHILPRCMGGEDRIDNYAKLTYKEHFIAHKLLCKFSGIEYLHKLEWAVTMMINGSSNPYANSYKLTKPTISIAYSRYYECNFPKGNYLHTDIKHHLKSKEGRSVSETNKVKDFFLIRGEMLGLTRCTYITLRNIVRVISQAKRDGYDGLSYSSSDYTMTKTGKTLIVKLCNLGYLKLHCMGNRVKSILTFEKEIPLSLSRSINLLQWKLPYSIPTTGYNPSFMKGKVVVCIKKGSCTSKGLKLFRIEPRLVGDPLFKHNKIFSEVLFKDLTCSGVVKALSLIQETL